MPTKKSTKTNPNPKSTFEETINVRGDQLVGKVKKLVKEGNVRRITIKDKKGKELIQFPLTFGVVGVILAPMLAAIGALAALVAECSITVEREKNSKS